MKKYVFVVLCLMAGPAFAQPAQNVTMNVTVAEATAVLNALGQGPWKDVNPLMQKLIAQINPQLTPPAPPEAPKTEAPKAPTPQSKFVPPKSFPESSPSMPLPPARPLIPSKKPPPG